MRSILVFFIKIYKWCISPLLGDCCRFHPTCSSYAVEALERHGSYKGSWLTLKRIAKCGFWHAGGVDEVPQ